jgi:hypothetical protein
MTKYEKAVIRPILSAVEKYQEFLTQPENLPQLAKLGFMFEKFWYAGRVAYGYDGRIKKGSSCENNPKYELGDTIKYLDSKIEDLVYDAWGMHVSNDPNHMSFEEIKNLIINGKELSDFEKRLRTPNKTFDEWVDVLTNPEYKYSQLYPDRRSVADHLLCTIGNGYGYSKETGMVFVEASGADQDQDIYGEWENAKFSPEIFTVVEKVLSTPELKLAIDAELEAVKEWEEKRRQEDRKEQESWYKMLLPLINEKRREAGVPEVTIDDPLLDEVKKQYVKELMKGSISKRTKAKKYEYYPICNYSIITMFDKNTHPSYIKAGLEICEDIVSNPPDLKKDFNQYQIDGRNQMIEFASKFIAKWKN